MIRRLSRSTFGYVSSLIRQGRVNGGRGLSSQAAKKEITAEVKTDEEANNTNCVTEKTPLVVKPNFELQNRDALDDVESQTQNLKVELKSGLLSSLSPTASTSTMASHKEDLEAVVCNASAVCTELSSATKIRPHEFAPPVETVVTIVDEVAGGRAHAVTHNLGSEAAEFPATVKEPKGKDRQPKVETPRLNYFVAIQIQDSEIRSKIQEVQERILDTTTVPLKSKASKGLKSIPGNVFKETMVPVEKLHFTLHVVHLKDDEDKEKAKCVLEKVGRHCQADFEQNPMVAEIEGLGHMRNTVIFAKMDGDENINRLTALAEKLRQEFEAVNIIGETRAFKPHMTVAKISRSKKLYRKNIKAFPRELWFEMESMKFGSQQVTGIQLLSMQDKPDSESGYYRALAEFNFNSN